MTNQTIINKFDEAIRKDAIIVIQYQDYLTNDVKCHVIKPEYNLDDDKLTITYNNSNVKKSIPLNYVEALVVSD